MRRMRAVRHTKKGRFTPIRLALILASVALLMFAVVGIALAAKPKAGYTYSTPGPTSPSVYFDAVSAKKLTDFSAGLALKCKAKTCGGFGGVKSLTSNSVKVSKTGTFKVSGNILTVNNKKLGTEIVTGKFAGATKVTGTVTTHASLGEYKGVTKSYKATGAPYGT
jgi:hypothetical protein